jgi:phosphopantothenoylcysteine synthetase/decarboxylase
MTGEAGDSRGVLYVISCGSRAASLVPALVARAQQDGWDVCVIVTPEGRKFVDVDVLERQTGHPVRSEYKHPDEPDVLPRADAVVAFPATFNTLNKWALGISDTLAVGILCEYTGLKMPVIAVPCVATSSGLDTHPAFPRSLAQLRGYGVDVIYEPDAYPPKNEVPASVIVRRLHALTRG